VASSLLLCQPMNGLHPLMEKAPNKAAVFQMLSALEHVSPGDL
jgi:hypothetical protein